MSADSASSVCEQCANKPSKAVREKEGEGEKWKTANVKYRQRKETNSESGARRRIFGDGLRSMGSARVGCQMRYVDGMLRQSGLCR